VCRESPSGARKLDGAAQHCVERDVRDPEALCRVRALQRDVIEADGLELGRRGVRRRRPEDERHVDLDVMNANSPS
jgi:hypothetical protein